jgi:CHAT domain-containing protein
MSIAIYKFIKTMKWEHRGTTIELFLVGIHHPNYPYKVWEEARAIWKVVIDGKENSGTRSGNREEVLQKLKDHIDWLIDDPEMTQLF